MVLPSVRCEPRERPPPPAAAFRCRRIDSVNRKAHAAVELLAIAPRHGDDVVVRESDGVLHAPQLRSDRHAAQERNTEANALAGAANLL